ncbi:PKD domain-containing protein [Cryobacterium roopkundense]|uniref:PKD domain-containing protein n=1 Tax=Cryobacterium roopkundense TaxID=1001240 RepID=A0A7W8ZTH1_9MICO|nr:hypothetical protein [Cryobacterium roopkundense]MBB5639889.1 hypothetical protein [Cryobacterium roopkundense]
MLNLSDQMDTSTGGTGEPSTGDAESSKKSAGGPAAASPLPPEDYKWKGLAGNQAYYIDKTKLTSTATPAPVCVTCAAPVVSSVSDLVGFSPHRPWQDMQPNGLAIVGLAANFVATASVHVVSGILLGNPADVRFTPVAFRWDFGDGASGTSTSGGASWDDLGVPEFSDTATSHIYAIRGDYVAQLTVDYAAEFRVGGGPWQPVSGTLPADANPLDVAARHVKSVLVAHDCNQNPAGVGCPPS